MISGAGVFSGVGSYTTSLVVSWSLSVRVGCCLFEGSACLTTIVLGSSSLSSSLSSSVSETSCDASYLNGRGFTSSNREIATRIAFM